MAAKKRKLALPKHLGEAEALARADASCTAAIKEAHASLHRVKLEDANATSLRNLNSEEVITWLVTKCGIQKIKDVSSFLEYLPHTIPPAQRTNYIRAHLGSAADTDLVCNIIGSGKCSPLTNAIFDNAASSLKVLAPPVKQCLRCASNLVHNHNCRVKVYALHLPHLAQHAEKVTLRCLKCRITYNYSTWGDKHENGFVYYENPRKLDEVNDTTYFDRKVLELQCSLA